MMNSYRVVGLMSGTSLDGVDLALCVLKHKGDLWSFEIEYAETIPYTTRNIRDLGIMARVSAVEYAETNVHYGKFLGSLVKVFLKKNKLEADFVASHGHTIFHQPQNQFTTQAGDGAALSVACGLPVVCDFRSADVALGGQGAPLVPIGDRYLFKDYDYCLNLGGIANISFEKSGKRLAYDICPVNIVLNSLALEKKKKYDHGGKLASRGKVNEKLLAKLNSNPFYSKSFPKSLGREDIEKSFLKIVKNDSSSVEDKLRTFCEHIAIQVAAAAGKKSGSMLITGGGAYNVWLVSRIMAHCDIEIAVPLKQIVEFKEALIFAFLGVLRWRNEINTLASVTGASRDSSGGAIYHP